MNIKENLIRDAVFISWIYRNNDLSRGKVFVENDTIQLQGTTKVLSALSSSSDECVRYC